jgi:hypothetical protein
VQGLALLTEEERPAQAFIRARFFYYNAAVLPGFVDIQSATYDSPEAVPARIHIQVADRIAWMERAHESCRLTTA